MQNPSTETRTPKARKVSTGIEELDKKLKGGFPPGSVIAMCYPPQSSGQLLGYMLSNRQFFEGDDEDEAIPLDILTTAVPKRRVRETLKAMDPNNNARLSGNLNLVETTITEFNHSDTDRSQASLDDLLARYKQHDAADQPSLVIDSFNEIGDVHSADVWHDFLTDVLNATRDQQGVAYLGLSRDTERAWLPYENHILRAVDGVLTYTSEAATDKIRLTRVRESEGPFPLEMTVNVKNRISVDPDRSR